MHGTSFPPLVTVPILAVGFPSSETSEREEGEADFSEFYQPEEALLSVPGALMQPTEPVPVVGIPTQSAQNLPLDVAIRATSITEAVTSFETELTDLVSRSITKHSSADVPVSRSYESEVPAPVFRLLSGEPVPQSMSMGTEMPSGSMELPREEYLPLTPTEDHPFAIKGAMKREEEGLPMPAPSLRAFAPDGHSDLAEPNWNPDAEPEQVAFAAIASQDEGSLLIDQKAHSPTRPDERPSKSAFPDFPTMLQRSRIVMPEKALVPVDARTYARTAAPQDWVGPPDGATELRGAIALEWQRLPTAPGVAFVRPEHSLGEEAESSNPFPSASRIRPDAAILSPLTTPDTPEPAPPVESMPLERTAELSRSSDGHVREVLIENDGISVLQARHEGQPASPEEGNPANETQELTLGPSFGDDPNVRAGSLKHEALDLIRTAPLTSSDGKPGLSATVLLAGQILENLTHRHNGSLTLTLSPEELGQVRVSFQEDRKNCESMMVFLGFDRPETMDLFRRHSDQLTEMLKAAGYSGVQIDFGGTGADAYGAQDGKEMGDDPSTEGTATTAEQSFGSTDIRFAGSAALDLRL